MCNNLLRHFIFLILHLNSTSEAQFRLFNNILTVLPTSNQRKVGSAADAQCKFALSSRKTGDNQRNVATAQGLCSLYLIQHLNKRGLNGRQSASIFQMVQKSGHQMILCICKTLSFLEHQQMVYFWHSSLQSQGTTQHINCVLLPKRTISFNT